jgi:DNA-binding transcriptional MerR regulator
MMSEVKSEGMIPIGQVAVDLGVTRKQLQDWHNAGLLPFCVVIGKDRNFLPSDYPKIEKVRDLMKEHKRVQAVKEKLGLAPIEAEGVQIISRQNGEIMPRDMEQFIQDFIEKTIGKEQLYNRIGNIENKVERINDLENELKLRDAKIEALEERQKNEWTTRWRIEQKLRQEAVQKWNAKPEDERMIITKFFGFPIFKTERTTEREDFIQSYVNEHIEKQYEQETGE